MKLKNHLKEISVLLTASGAPSSTSYIDCLKNNYEQRKVNVVSTDIVDQPIMHYKADNFHLLPKGNSKKYIESLIKLCKKENISVVLPCSDSEVFTISKNLDLLKSKKIIVAVSGFDTIKKIMDKFSVFQLLKEHKIPQPRSVLVHNRKEFDKALELLGFPKKPVSFKPSKYTSSGGGRGFRILRSNNSIQDIILNQKPGSIEIDYETASKLFQNENLDLIVMEYLPGHEYSVHILAKNGKMLYCVPFQKKRAIHGHSLESVVKANDECVAICKKIIKIFNFDFNVNVQFKLTRQGKPKLVEINPRIGGGISLPTAAGVNLPYLSVKLALGENLPPKKIIYKTTMIRYWKELFVRNSREYFLSS